MIRDWARDIKHADYATETPSAQEIVEGIRSLPNAKEVAHSLSRDRDPQIRSWVASIAYRLLGDEAVALLRNMSRSDRDETTRVVARNEIERLDSRAINQVIPDLLRALRIARHPFGEARNAMWLLGRHHITASVPELRRFASRWPYGDYGHMMATILADYVENPAQINERLLRHDHEWTFWLAEAAALLPTIGGLATIRQAFEAAPDSDCSAILRDQLRAYGNLH